MLMVDEDGGRVLFDHGDRKPGGLSLTIAGDDVFEADGVSRNFDGKSLALFGAKLRSSAIRMRVGEDFADAWICDDVERGAPDELCAYTDVRGGVELVVRDPEGNDPARVVLRPRSLRLSVAVTGYLGLDQIASLGELLFDLGVEIARDYFNAVDLPLLRKLVKGRCQRWVGEQ